MKILRAEATVSSHKCQRELMNWDWKIGQKANLTISA